MSADCRKSTDIRRVEIADAALRLAERRGARAVTAKNLAAEVGVTAGALFRHFGSLSDVLILAVDRAMAAVEASFPPLSVPPVERLRQVALARVRLTVERPGLAWLLLSDQPTRSLPEPAVARLRGLVSTSRAYLAAAFAEAVAQGALRRDIPVETQLLLFGGAVHALIGARGVHHRAEGPHPTEPQAVLDTFFGLLAPTSQTTAPSDPSSLFNPNRSHGEP